MNIKCRNILLSLITVAVCTGLLLLWSAKVTSDLGDKFFLYICVQFTSVIVLWASVLLIILRTFRLFDQEHNFLYSFLAVTNTILGLSGVILYLLGKINTVGLHALLLNLLVCVVLFADILFFKSVFQKP